MESGVDDRSLTGIVDAAGRPALRGRTSLGPCYGGDVSGGFRFLPPQHRRESRRAGLLRTSHTRERVATRADWLSASAPRPEPQAGRLTSNPTGRWLDSKAPCRSSIVRLHLRAGYA